ncbi:MAG: ribonuclease III [Methyloligellaceae bacterium]
MSRGAKSITELADRLGYAFREPERLKLALTHSSARASRNVSRDNERLEFLGDRVLGLCIAELLMETYPQAPEGDLARRLNRLVRKETCAQVAENSWKLGAHMILSGDDVLREGRSKRTILGNACEAVLGAIFLDGGYDAARQVVRRFWEPLLDDASGHVADAKTALQEWAQGQGKALPHYRDVGRSGPDHAPHFTVEVSVEGVPPVRGEGKSKRVAEQAAARALLLREGVWESGDGNS